MNRFAFLQARIAKAGRMFRSFAFQLSFGYALVLLIFSALSFFNQTRLEQWALLFDLVQSFYEDYTAAQLEAKQEYAALISNTRTITLWATGAAVAVAVAVAVFAVLTLYSGFRGLNLRIQRMKEGDLSIVSPVRRNDELGRLLRHFDESIAAFGSIVTQTRDAAERLRKHSAQFHDFTSLTKVTNTGIVHAMEKIASGASKQAEQAEASGKAIASLKQQVEGMAQSSEALIASSQEGKQSTKEGMEKVADLYDSTAHTENALRAMSDSLSALVQQSKEVAQIADTIQTISRKTNILALNASIESSRAGAHGSGFSVIAEEVRKLALQTAEQSKSIAEQLVLLEHGVQKAAEGVGEAADRFAVQQENVHRTGEAFRLISEKFHDVDGEINRITERILETRRDTAKLAAAIHAIVSVAETTAAGAEEIHASAATQDESIRRVADEAKDIRSLAELLFEEIHGFKPEAPQ